MYRSLLNFFSKSEALIWGRRLKPLYSNTRRLLNPPKCGPYLSNYCNLQFKSLLHLGQNVITFRTLLQLGQNVITFRTLLHLGSFITFRPSTPVNKNTYWVIYLPTRPGDYVISILHCGAHILRNPFYLTLPAPNGVHTLKTPSKFHSQDLLYISLPSLHDYKVKVPNFEFCRGRKHETTTFLFFSWTLIQSFRIELQKICQHLTN